MFCLEIFEERWIKFSQKNPSSSFSPLFLSSSALVTFPLHPKKFHCNRLHARARAHCCPFARSFNCRFNAAKAERYRLQVAIALEAKIAMHGTEGVHADRHRPSDGMLDRDDDGSDSCDDDDADGYIDDTEADEDDDPSRVGGGAAGADVGTGGTNHPEHSTAPRYNPGGHEIYNRSEEEHYEMGTYVGVLPCAH